jgi:hypothetical protein
MIQKEWPEEQVVSTQSQVADCLEFLGKRDLALAAYQDVFNAQRTRRSERTTAHMTFAWIVATEGIRHLYDEALQVLEEFALPIEFPVDRYKSNAVRALIFGDRGEKDLACVHAKIALEAMERTTSGLQYHKSVGLVSNPDEKVVHRLRSLMDT